jgi:hypothetical protein
MRKLTVRAFAALAAVAVASVSHAYPLDASGRTGIMRLEAYALSQTGSVRGPLLAPGAQLPESAIALRLLDNPGFTVPEPDPALSEILGSLLGGDADAYGLVVLDLSDPARPRFGAHNPDLIQNPGSVGKLLINLGWFQALADVYPDDVEARHALMRDTVVKATPFIQWDSHDVPFWQPGDAAIDFRPIQMSDSGNLWTWLDWMSSSSSNAAASLMISQTILLRHFGTEYPVSPERAEKFFRETPKAKLSGLLREAIQLPVKRAGLDLTQLRQGAFFTSEGKNRIPGTNSVSTPRELLRLLLRIEKGMLVDRDSSLEMKRLIYLAERRIRYAGSLALRRAALYFKSGSLYSCRPEPGFVCEKYHGNVRNFLNSAVIIETQEEPRLHYIVVLQSNVLRRDSADLHRQLATEIHEILDREHRAVAPAVAPAPAAEIDFDEEIEVDAEVEADAEGEVVPEGEDVAEGEVVPEGEDVAEGEVVAEGEADAEVEAEAPISESSDSPE